MTQPEAAVAIVEAQNPEPSVLLMRRSEREGDSWSGHWSFPGGRCEPEDADALDTARRELEEECGIRLERSHLAATLPVRLARRRVGRFIPVAPFHFLVDQPLPASLCALEAVEEKWVPLSVLRDPERHVLRPVPGLPDDMLYPAINLTETPLWGFTYRLITSWLGLDAGHPGAGKEAARQVMDFLLSSGLSLREDWGPPAETDPPVVEAARVNGPIPVEKVRAHFSAAGFHNPAINRLWVRPDSILLAGPAFEEYLISS
jgi:8-oxo-dGTP pyrophosphatase MutT (NUDIX family)